MEESKWPKYQIVPTPTFLKVILVILVKCQSKHNHPQHLGFHAVLKGAFARNLLGILQNPDVLLRQLLSRHSCCAWTALEKEQALITGRPQIDADELYVLFSEEGKKQVDKDWNNQALLVTPCFRSSFSCTRPSSAFDLYISTACLLNLISRTMLHEDLGTVMLLLNRSY